MKLLEQFTFSSVSAMTVHISFFIITALLDKIINSELANFIGLVVDLILDFIVQQYVFMKKISLDFKIIVKYVGSEAVFLLLNQFIFSVYYRNYYDDSHNLTIARAIIGMFIYTFFVFPTRKFFIYK
jgi:putative flippase GtrA